MSDEEELEKEPETAGPVEEERSSVFSQIRHMTVTERIKLARRGNQELRRLLISDPVRSVQVAVLSNPRITDSEITVIASSKSVDDEVLRLIMNNREWIRHYSVKLALVKNPRTPVQAALRFLPHLLDKDLRELEASRSVPNALRVNARMALSRRKRR